MKARVFILLLVVKITISFSNSVNVNAYNFSNFCLEISGSLHTKNDVKNDPYIVELLFDNKVLKQTTVTGRRSFKFLLAKNRWYAIRISKKGYSPRLISICTDLPKSKEGFYKFHFDTELIPINKAELMDQEVLDFPIAIISFDKDAEWFYYNEEFTSNMKRQLYKPLLANSKND